MMVEDSAEEMVAKLVYRKVAGLVDKTVGQSVSELAVLMECVLGDCWGKYSVDLLAVSMV
jgi:hypothetical protein